MWKIYDERVYVLKQRYAFFPDLFLWRGRYHQVHSVQRCWVRSRKAWRRRIERRFFQVQCSAGTFELFQDLREGTWHVRRALLGAAPNRALGRPGRSRPEKAAAATSGGYGHGYRSALV